jgi:diguanylate cyclase (GGDEF)-like protein/PAS domain S-box-containing protein
MSSHSPVADQFELSAELIEATQSQEGAARDAALGAVARRLLESPQGGFFSADIDSGHEIKQEVTHDGACFGHFALAGRPGGYGVAERERLAALAQLTGRLLQMHENNRSLSGELGRFEVLANRQAQILDQVNDAIINLDLHGRITDWNKTAERLLGYSADEAIGQNISILQVADDADDVIGEIVPMQIEDLLLEQCGSEIELRRRKKSGAVFWASQNLSLVRDSAGVPSGMICTLTDISTRFEAAQNHLLNTRMFDLSDEGIYVTDAEERIISVNQALLRITGYTLAEVIGKTPRMFDSDLHDEFFHQCRMEAIRGGGSWHGEIWERRKNGEVYPKWASISTMKDARGRITHYFSIFCDITERKRNEERINYLAYYDALTGLPNRTLFQKLVEQALIEAQRNQMQGALLFIDLNRFKPINDSLGHDVGDRLLLQVGQRFRAALRDADVVARIGGDEFVVGLFDITRRDHASNVAQKLLAALETSFLIDGNELRIGASIGISVYPDDSLDAVTLLRYADVAMYRAKQNKQSCYTFFSHEMNQYAVDRLRIEAGLRRALDRGELLLHYQPKMNIATGRIVGAEALVRWAHPDRLISPSEFIPIAEESGLIVGIGEWVLEEVCKQTHAWKQGGMLPLKIAVNISARQFTSKLPSSIATLLERYEIAAEWLELELTESMLMHNTEGVIKMMDDLNAIGITLSLDDFGTGYSSLSYLKRFPIDTLKIDRSFITGTPESSDDCAITGAITSMAKQLELKVIAEGVETQAQLDFLTFLECDEIQGFLFSKPLPAEEFLALMQAESAGHAKKAEAAAAAG